MNNIQNRRETGARKYPANTDPDPSDEFSQDAASNERPHVDPGLSRKQGEVEDKTHQSKAAIRRGNRRRARRPKKAQAPALRSRSIPRTRKRPGAAVSPAPM